MRIPLRNKKVRNTGSDAANGLKQTIKDALNENNHTIAVEMTEKECERRTAIASNRHKATDKKPFTLALNRQKLKYATKVKHPEKWRNSSCGNVRIRPNPPNSY